MNKEKRARLSHITTIEQKVKWYREAHLNFLNAAGENEEQQATFAARDLLVGTVEEAKPIIESIELYLHEKYEEVTNQ